MVGPYCAKCQYLGEIYGIPCCNYIEITGRSRGSPSGEGCTKRIIGKKRPTIFFTNFLSEAEKQADGSKRTVNHRNMTESEWCENERDRKRRESERNKTKLAGRQKEVLTSYMEDHHITILQLAMSIGVSRSTVGKWVNEHRKADWGKLSKLGIEKPEGL